jgi:hypothetical protein
VGVVVLRPLVGASIIGLSGKGRQSCFRSGRLRGEVSRAETNSHGR